MKKIFASLTIFAAMLAGCQKPELDVPAGVQEAYTATVEAFGAQTKTSLAPNNQIIWTADDRLAVFQASTIADEYKLVEGCEGLTNASFRIVAEDVTLNGDFVAGTEIPCNVAVYPYSENLVLSVVKDVSFNFMAAVTICSDFGAQKIKVCHCFPIYLP